MQSKTFVLKAKRSGGRAGKYVGVLHITLRGGEKGQGKVWARHTSLDTPRDYAEKVTELLTFVRSHYGIEPWQVLNKGPHKLPYRGPLASEGRG